MPQRQLVSMGVAGSSRQQLEGQELDESILEVQRMQPYVIEMLSEGFWDGQYRCRCGFRVIGFFASFQEAEHSACIDWAIQNQRIVPARPSTGSRATVPGLSAEQAGEAG